MFLKDLFKGKIFFRMNESKTTLIICQGKNKVFFHTIPVVKNMQSKDKSNVKVDSTRQEEGEKICKL